eukprot:scaffold5.g939.t1
MIAGRLCQGRSGGQQAAAECSQGEGGQRAGVGDPWQLELTKLPALSLTGEPGSNAQQQLLLARQVLELAVLLSIKQQDEVAFERNYNQLRTYYTDSRTALPPSDQARRAAAFQCRSGRGSRLAARPLERMLVSLNLLRLLVQNRIAEFHTELEVIPDEVQAAPEVAQVVELEQWLMEGAYNKVLDARSRAASDYYAYFLDSLSSTVRDEIASCSERAYESLSLADAASLLMLGSADEAAAYAQQHGWEVVNGHLAFKPQAGQKAAAAPPPSLDIISNCLSYAKELERIVPMADRDYTRAISVQSCQWTVLGAEINPHCFAALSSNMGSQQPAPSVSFGLYGYQLKGEDASCVEHDQQFSGPWSLFAVADGHHGKAAVTCVRAFLKPIFRARLTHAMSRGSGSVRSGGDGGGGAMHGRLGATAMKQALAQTFLTLDHNFSTAARHSGCTLTVAVVAGRLLTVANVGDSAAVLDTGAEVVQLTDSHRIADNGREQARLAASGAHVAPRRPGGGGPAEPAGEGVGPLRLWPGGVTLSRAIGDPGVGRHQLPHPAVKQASARSRQPLRALLAGCVVLGALPAAPQNPAPLSAPQITVPAAGARLIVATDGLWDAIPAGKVAQALRNARTPEAAANLAVRLAQQARSNCARKDDITVCVVDLLPPGTDSFQEVWRQALPTRNSTPSSVEEEGPPTPRRHAANDWATTPQTKSVTTASASAAPAPKMRQRRGLLFCFHCPPTVEEAEPAVAPRRRHQLSAAVAPADYTAREIDSTSEVVTIAQAKGIHLVCEEDTATWTPMYFQSRFKQASPKDSLAEGAAAPGAAAAAAAAAAWAARAACDDLPPLHSPASLAAAEAAGSKGGDPTDSAFLMPVVSPFGSLNETYMVSAFSAAAVVGFEDEGNESDAETGGSQASASDGEAGALAVAEAGTLLARLEAMDSPRSAAAVSRSASLSAALGPPGGRAASGALPRGGSQAKLLSPPRPSLSPARKSLSPHKGASDVEAVATIVARLQSGCSGHLAM